MNNRTMYECCKIMALVTLAITAIIIIINTITFTMTQLNTMLYNIVKEIIAQFTYTLCLID